MTTEGATSGGTLLSGGNYISTTTFEWKTDQVANGTYFFYVRFTNGQSVHAASGGDTSVVVNNSGNKLPVVKLKGGFKVGSMAIRDDQDQTITYDVTDEDPDSVMTVKLEYSIDNGTWLQVTEQTGVTPGTGKTIVWPAAQISESPLYKVRIRAPFRALSATEFPALKPRKNRKKNSFKVFCQVPIPLARGLPQSGGQHTWQQAHCFANYWPAW